MLSILTYISIDSANTIREALVLYHYTIKKNHDEVYEVFSLYDVFLFPT